MVGASGVRVNSNALSWQFKPSLEITAARANKLGLDIRSFREPLKRVIKEVMAPSFRKNFDEGGRPPWAPLSDETIRTRDYLGFPPGPTLVRSGQLRKTIQQENIWTYSKDAISIQNLPQKIWYGKVHQAGHNSGIRGAINAGLLPTTSPSRKSPSIPQRQFVMIQDEDFNSIEQVFDKWIQQRIRMTWSRGM